MAPLSIHVKSLNGIFSIFESVKSSFLLVDEKNLVQPRPAAAAGMSMQIGLW